MKISYNWLKEYIDVDLNATTVARYLTDTGLEVEGIEHVESVKGGLKGIVIGEVLTKEQHPNADRLSITTVNIGQEEALKIVCGAPNVEAGQKVPVATIGTVLYSDDESFKIKKGKIRGEVSEGMICAEDEIGLGDSHEGIMVLDSKAKVGQLASEYFNIETDIVFEIGLTPNRSCKLPKSSRTHQVEVKFGTKTIFVDDPSGEKDDKGDVKQIEKKVDNIINNTTPTWTKTPQDLNEEDYSNFYKELYPTEFNDPIFNIHLNVDYPFNLTGILYFPKLKNNLEVQKNKINLYSNQVFITDNVENIVPEFLTLLHGVIDSPDIPLNVSRSYLQADGNVKKISKYITKKVGDKLSSMFKNDREDFESKWDEIKVFIEYGMLTEDKFFEKAKDFCLYKNTDNKYSTFNELIERVKDNQTNKNDKTIVLYTHNKEEQDSFINSAITKNYEVIELEGPLVSHLISKLESENSNVQFARVDADTIEKLIEKEDKTLSLLSEEEEKNLKEIIEKKIDDKKFNIQIESLSTSDSPFIITQSEFMRRMKEQQHLSGGMNVFGEIPESYNLAVNSNHPISSQILNESDENIQSKLINQALDLALLSQGLLKGKKLTEFITRSVSMINSKK